MGLFFCFATKGVLRHFTKFTGKHLCQSLFFKKDFIKKEALAQVFSCEFCEISKNTIFTEHLWTTASRSEGDIRVVWGENISLGNLSNGYNRQLQRQ